MTSEDNLITLTAEIVASYVANNATPAGELPGIIKTIHAALSGVGLPVAAEPEASAKPTAAQVRRSVTPEALISFIDGKPYRMLKRHLTTRGMTAAEYRTTFGLPSDYPMVAPAYSEARSVIAKARGLGRTAKAPSEPIVAEGPAPAPKAPRRRLGIAKTE